MRDRAAQLLGYEFRDDKVLGEALRHASSASRRLDSNERLEFLGDAVMGFVVCEYIFKVYPDMLEGDLTKIKSAVVSRKVCAAISEKLGLASMLNLGKGMTGRAGLPSSVIAAVLESLVAAIYLDGGMEPARKFVLEQLKPYIDEAAGSTHRQDFKSTLQQYVQKRYSASPTYVTLDEKGPDHAKAFEVCVSLEERQFPSAWANSKKEAEQRAALLALAELGVAHIDDEGRVTLPGMHLAGQGKPNDNAPAEPEADSTQAE